LPTMILQGPPVAVQHQQPYAEHPQLVMLPATQQQQQRQQLVLVAAGLCLR
jgi:hypothetical protein